MNAVEKPAVLVIENEHYMYGLREGYYPEEKKAYEETMSLEVMTRKQVDELWGKDVLAKQSSAPIAQTYVLNKVEGRYYPTDSPSLSRDLAASRALAYKTMLKMMGAIEIVLKKNSEECSATQRESEVEASGEYGVVGANSKYNSKHEQSAQEAFSSSIEFKDNVGRPRPVDDVRRWVLEKGLMEDSVVRSWMEEYAIYGGQMSGTENYEVAYLTELDTASQIHAALQAKIPKAMVCANLKYETKARSTYKITEVLRVRFS